ncbi:MAG: fibrillarin-like rRNA/tRNA 2'-O-methyltransferase [Candidatus Diapherotrites archaeon]|uniref:Fibrillarin-like rRNA/tRNA 2'-O-methyltransferase n=1 Tax=Candidatus Iainarchaeum sp. TaxID=3101447 RepID=A0A8T4KZN8_9ARCH|nr:MAG: fibrillarin-like protein pre-rRNA processing protein [archaeon GW2011_AR10]MBS3059687.1 fibrillarin-like rRNA/tRNA 2'-O-methyltransferase [Candidatus Diapherotrites archaeon]
MKAAEIREIFPGVFRLDSQLATKNLVKGVKVYGENLLQEKGFELRLWNPYRSKLAAAIKKGLTELPVKEKSVVLYLGAAEGTTVSHISDIIGEKGAVFGVDISARTMRKFYYLCEQRKNVYPILADASQPATYKQDVAGFPISVLYQDVSQKHQAEIFLKNSRMHLQMDGYGMLVIKASSISSSKKKEKVAEEEVAKLEKEFSIIQLLPLEPFDKEHYFVLCKKK